MKILFVSLTFPLPATNGYRMRILSLLRALHAEGHETSLLTLATEEEARNTKPLLEFCRNVAIIPFTPVSWSGGGNYLGRVRYLLSPTPFGVARFDSEAMRSRLLSMVHSERIEAVVAETPYALINCPSNLPVPLVLDDQNLEHMILKRYLRSEKSILKRLYAWWEWRKLRNWEGKACARSQLTLVCSEVDRSGMSELCPQAKVLVVPNIIDFDAYAPANGSNLSKVVYVGGLDWFPNRDAVEFFATSILPELRKLAPGIEFIAAYSPDHAPPEEFRQRFSSIPGVQFVETPNVRKVMSEAGVVAVPIRIGSGTRFKILEAAAMNKAIVSTRVGAEGLDFQDPKEIRLVDAPAAFARAIADLLADARTRDTMGGAARKKVAERYSFPVLRRMLCEALGELSGAGQQA